MRTKTNFCCAGARPSAGPCTTDCLALQTKSSTGQHEPAGRLKLSAPRNFVSANSAEMWNIFGKSIKSKFRTPPIYFYFKLFRQFKKKTFILGNKLLYNDSKSAVFESFRYLVFWLEYFVKPFTNFSQLFIELLKYCACTSPLLLIIIMQTSVLLTACARQKPIYYWGFKHAIHLDILKYHTKV